MTCILLVSKAPDNFSELAVGLEKRDGIDLIRVESQEEAFEKAKEVRLDVVVVDDELADGKGLDLVTGLVQKYPLINCALVSALSDDDFHEYTEGLGVFMQLPPRPAEEDARKMLEILDSIDVLLKAE
jgi:DNA-binding NarL/FixJ family response regulator